MDDFPASHLWLLEGICIYSVEWYEYNGNTLAKEGKYPHKYGEIMGFFI